MEAPEDYNYDNYRRAIDHLRSLPADLLKERLLEYLDESDHGSWEGYEWEEWKAIEALLIDFRTFNLNYGVLGTEE